MRVPVTGLVGHPGETRALTRVVPAEDFGADPWGPVVGEFAGPVALDLHLDAVVEGVLIRGTIGFEVSLPCGRCLTAQTHTFTTDVAELFVDPTRRDEQDEDDPGYELVDDLTAVDLSTLVRDALVVDLPVRVLCRENCLGLCPTCGVDRNVTDCGHRPTQERDPRWDALADLDLPVD